MKLHKYMKWTEFHRGEIGLEIETETQLPYEYVSDLLDFWTTHPDGSLRNNGVEYVFRIPLDYKSKEYTKALDLFDKQVKQTKFLKSPYSSVHVHLNMNDKDMISILNFVTLYFLFEEILAEYCGNERNGNLFCLKASNAEQIFKIFRDMTISIWNGSGYSFIRNLNNAYLKYSGLNIVPLRTQGSLEVRTHPGTVKREEIERWVGILYKIYSKADKYLSPVEIVNRLLGARSKESFCIQHFEEFSEFLNLSNLDIKMEDSIWYATSIAGCIESWKDFGNKKDNSKILGHKSVFTFDTLTDIPNASIPNTQNTTIPDWINTPTWITTNTDT